MGAGASTVNYEREGLKKVKQLEEKKKKKNEQKKQKTQQTEELVEAPQLHEIGVDNSWTSTSCKLAPIAEQWREPGDSDPTNEWIWMKSFLETSDQLPTSWKAARAAFQRAS